MIRTEGSFVSKVISGPGLSAFICVYLRTQSFSRA